jgi:hypothetical protein
LLFQESGARRDKRTIQGGFGNDLKEGIPWQKTRPPESQRRKSNLGKFCITTLHKQGFSVSSKPKKIWATDIFYLNDSAEMKHAWKIAKEVLRTPGISKCPGEDRILEGILSFSDLPFSQRCMWLLFPPREIN